MSSQKSCRGRTFGVVGGEHFNRDRIQDLAASCPTNWFRRHKPEMQRLCRERAGSSSGDCPSTGNDQSPEEPSPDSLDPPCGVDEDPPFDRRLEPPSLDQSHQRSPRVNSLQARYGRHLETHTLPLRRLPERHRRVDAGSPGCQPSLSSIRYLRLLYSAPVERRTDREAQASRSPPLGNGEAQRQIQSTELECELPNSVPQHVYAKGGGAKTIGRTGH